MKDSPPYITDMEALVDDIIGELIEVIQRLEREKLLTEAGSGNLHSMVLALADEFEIEMRMQGMLSREADDGY